jgi:hypothetical protein
MQLGYRQRATIRCESVDGSSIVGDHQRWIASVRDEVSGGTPIA